MRSKIYATCQGRFDVRLLFVAVAVHITFLEVHQSYADWVMVDLSPYANARIQNYQPEANSFPEGNVTLGGVPFNIQLVGGNNAWNAEVVTGPYPHVLDVAIDIAGATEVHTLINTFYGQPGPASYITLEFFGSAGAYHRKDLIGNVDVRDHLEAYWTNSINNTTTINVFSTGGGLLHDNRLDKQQIVLPDSFHDQVLLTMRLTSTGGVLISDASIQGLTVQSLCGGPLEGSTVEVWGSNSFGQSNEPVTSDGFEAIAGAIHHSVGLRSDGTIVAWGNNSFGQCNVPAPNSEFIAMAAGGWHTVGVKSSGSIVAWGWNGQGQCNVPLPNTDFLAAAAGNSFSLGLKADGMIVAWGNNNFGQCSVPAPNSDFVAIAAGEEHGLGLKADGSIVAWGRNESGQCNVPAPNTSFVAVAAGIAHSLALKADGSIVAWGRNDAGQCNVPQPNASFVALAAGGYHALGLKSSGSILAWGLNSYGQCNVPSPNSGFQTVAAGEFHSIGLKSSGNFVDCNGNGALDVCDLISGTSNDCDTNGLPDECQSDDFDEDGLPNPCDPDIDDDGVDNADDVCDFTRLGAVVLPDGNVRADLDGDCDVDLADYAILQNDFTGPWVAPTP